MKRLAATVLLMLTALALVWANPYAGPVSLVVVDAGHGGNDPGAIGNRLEEKDLTLEISLRLADELVSRGYNVCLTRSDDSFLSLQERCDFANSQDFDITGYPIFISIHINSATSASASGFEVYVRQNSRDVAMLSPSTSDHLALKYASYTNSQLNAYEQIVSRRLAENICERFSSAFPRTSMRGVKSGDLWVLNGTWMPSVLVEVGFISNPDEASTMATSSFQDRLARLIAEAVDSL